MAGAVFLARPQVNQRHPVPGDVLGQLPEAHPSEYAGVVAIAASRLAQFRQECLDEALRDRQKSEHVAGLDVVPKLSTFFYSRIMPTARSTLR